MAKVRVRFIGSAQAAILSTTPDHPSIQFQRYGQLAELDQDIYQKILAGHYGARLGLITDEEFTSLGHPDSEVKQFGAFETHLNATKEFKARVEKANELMLKNHQAADLLFNNQTEPDPITPIVEPTT